MAAMLGKPLMPWQQYVMDVAFEVDPSTGRLVYREVRQTVPRQSGKTTGILALTTHRGLATQQFGPRNHIVYTAQTRKDAGMKWREDFLEDLKASRALRGKFTYKLAPGSEHVRWQNGSRFGVEATTEKAGHGTTLDLGIIDEAFAHVDSRVEQAFRPAMITRPQPQLWVVSTAGWLGGSPYLWSKVEHGRQLVENDVTEGIAYFEWSADPDDDPEDPATWWSCMPALGHTVTEDAVRAELEGMKGSPEGLNGFKRAYLNLWVPKNAPAEQIVPADAWNAAQVSEIDWLPPFVASLDVNPERSRGSIAIAARFGERVAGEVVADRDGTWWMVDRALALHESHAPKVWLVDARSPAISLVSELEAAGLTVRTTNAAEMADACGKFYDAAIKSPPGLAHVGQPEMTAALAGAKKRPIGDAFGWDRRGVANIAPLVAWTLAAYGVSTLPGATEAVPPRQAPRTREPELMSLRW